MCALQLTVVRQNIDKLQIIDKQTYTKFLALFTEVVSDMPKVAKGKLYIREY